MYVARRADRNRSICGAWTLPQFPGQEKVAVDNAELQVYLNRNPLTHRLAYLGLSVDDLRSALAGAGMYVDRDGSAGGNIVAAWDTPQRDGHEMLPIDAAELQAFLSRQS